MFQSKFKELRLGYGQEEKGQNMTTIRKKIYS